MNRRKGILIALGVVVLIVGCTLVLRPISKTKKISKDEVVKEVNTGEITKNKEETLAKLLEGKYLYDDSVDSKIGTVSCFNKDEVVALYPYEADVNKIKKTSTDTNTALFELESNEHGSPEIIIKSKFKIEKTNDTSVTLVESSNVEPTGLSKSLNILTTEESEKAIDKVNPDYVQDQNGDDLGLKKELFTKTFGSVQTSTSSDENIISSEKALQLCKDKLSGFKNTDYLTLGKNTPGMPSGGKYNGVRYIYVYYMIDGIAADYRYCVKESDGSIYYEDSANIGKLIDIDTHITNNKSISDSEPTIKENEDTTERKKISESEAIALCDKRLKELNFREFESPGSVINTLEGDYYQIVYDGGDAFAVHMYTGEVFYSGRDGISNLE
ncbi:hypothetical protein B2H97_14015 [Paraclostridium bifermentans]|uniref:hypothetical protein n=1 Tax=Paraclostridium bifermentans TaxID=1490 RepID=UPI000A170B81|nr:hypothetical protein [Paraclostridium bifermentans]OSB08480.1 hypothetical protein B2H97_14015 [Paraclostridium bifermentans]